MRFVPEPEVLLQHTTFVPPPARDDPYELGIDEIRLNDVDPLSSGTAPA